VRLLRPLDRTIDLHRLSQVVTRWVSIPHLAEAASGQAGVAEAPAGRAVSLGLRGRRVCLANLTMANQHLRWPVRLGWGVDSSAVAAQPVCLQVSLDVPAPWHAA